MDMFQFSRGFMMVYYYCIFYFRSKFYLAASHIAKDDRICGCFFNQFDGRMIKLADDSSMKKYALPVQGIAHDPAADKPSASL